MQLIITRMNQPKMGMEKENEKKQDQECQKV